MSEAELPLISVVTPCLNGLPYVKEAVESVLAQNYPNFEHIIVDNGSTDGTIEALETYSHLKISHEPKKGIYPPLNKALGMARGDLVGWLNADDLFPEGIFHRVVEIYQEDPSLEMVCGTSVEFVRQGDDIEFVRTHPFTSEDDFRKGKIDPRTNINSSFYSLELLERVGPFKEKYKISSDLDYLIRLALARPHFSVHDDIFYLIRCHEQSFTFSERPSKETVMRVSRDGFEICARYMNDDNLPKPIQDYARLEFRRRILMRGQYQLIYEKNLSGVLETLKLSLESGLLTPFWIFGQMFMRPFKKISRKLSLQKQLEKFSSLSPNND